MTRYTILVILAVAALTVTFWAMINRPGMVPPWPEQITGFAFSPMRSGQSPVDGDFPSPEQIDADLALLAGKTKAIRSYTVEGTLGEIPALARAYGLRVTLGAWLDGDMAGNEAELERLLSVIGGQLHANRVIVGNEALWRNDLTVEQIIGYLDWTRERLVARVSTAEPWHVWLRYPQLADHVDFITAHILPYWEGEDVDEAVAYVDDKMERLRVTFPDKDILIGEVGWPSRGRDRGRAVASPANEATFLRRFLRHATREGYDYFVLEAFDQPWKRISEGDVGAYWGVYDVERQPKFEFEQPVVAVPAWRILAAVSVVVATVVFALLLLDSRTLGRPGRNFLAVIAFSAVTAAVWVVYDYTQQYLTVEIVLVGALLMLGMIGVLLVVLAEAHEWAEAHWVIGRRRAFQAQAMSDADLPKVSIQVPAYNEPPEMMIATLDALAQLDYPDFEVLVIDNNTKDPAVWEPVRAHCERLGSSFRFFHVDSLPGFKAGALNYALTLADPQAEVVAVIDSDYQVDPCWLRDLVPQFRDAEIAIVQAPQDYRDGNANAFKSMCYAEYRGFFFIGMITRNERNAIIQHGTMTLVRRSVLEGVGGWAEWTITEDAELGLRIFEQGHQAMYVPRSYGRGLMPDTFLDYKKQRARWAFGAVQIMRAHLGKLLGLRPSRLTPGQRYHFWAGWLPWLADGLNLFFSLAAIAWSVGMIMAPLHFDPPLIAFSLLPLVLFGFKVAKLVYLYRSRVDAGTGQTLGAAWAGLALTHEIGTAVLSGLLRRSKPFFRTPKLARPDTWLGALAAARTEALLAAALLLAVAGIRITQTMGGLDLFLWTLVLLVQAIPYLAAVTLSWVACMPRLGAGPFAGPQQAAPGPCLRSEDSFPDVGQRL
jgi:exo-beta-1,3-glucanase (GH17 family)/cellulose synthase/poly-beta-1,6-N-acetylglucosamine synthase-like glycosyltransferase